jgi:hypothetical protein
MTNPLAPPRRNYVRRKQFLNESVDLLKKTLECLASSRGELPNPSEISQQALARALEIEAACWTRLARPTNEDYHRMITDKTKDVCRALISKAIGAATQPHCHQRLLTGLAPVPRLPPRPGISIPITGVATERPDFSSRDSLFPMFSDANRDDELMLLCRPGLDFPGDLFD